VLCNKCLGPMLKNYPDATVCGRCVREAEMEYELSKMCEENKRLREDLTVVPETSKQELCPTCPGYTCDHKNCPACQEGE